MSVINKKYITFSIIAILAISLAFTILKLEDWVKNYINNEISSLEGYSGNIKEIDLHLWRGAYEIKGLKLEKEKGGLKESFLTVKNIDLSIQWGALLNGQLVAEVDIEQPDLKFAKKQTGKGSDWASFTKSLMPFNLNKLTVKDGKVAYIDWMADPNIHLFIKNLNATVTNISNVLSKEVALPSKISASGITIGGGKLSFKDAMNLLKATPDFDFAIEIEKADLPYFNNYAEKYAALSFKNGNISLYGEGASANGKLVGYFKPIATNIVFENLKEENNPLTIIWTSIASLFVDTFENEKKDQFALRIPFEGDLNNPDQNLWEGFWSIFRNAFDTASKKNVDGTIEYKDAVEESSKK